MNDFTKEELDELRASRCYHLDDNYPYEDSVFMKIQSLIDNYCEHDCEHEWDGILITTKPNTGKCKKCSQICYIAFKEQ